MNTAFAILIDAGFAKRKLKGKLGYVPQAEDFATLVATICQHEYLKHKSLYRVFYYDAPPADNKLINPLNNNVVDLSSSTIAKDNKRLLEALKIQPYFALRMGQVSTNGDSWKIKHQGSLAANGSVTLTADDIVPNITQKGVDMKIGLDMATLALKKQVGVIVLVTADSDFVPAMKLARMEGVQIFLAHMGHTIKPELKEHSDVLLNYI